MAWITSGTVIEKKTEEWKTQTSLNYIKTINEIITCDNECCLAMVRDSLNDGIKLYAINVYKKKTGELLYKGNSTQTVDEEYPNDPSKNSSKTYTYSNFNSTGPYHEGHADYSRSSVKYTITTTIPNFDDDGKALQKYIKNGDTSGAIKYLNTNWNLYIDGKSNPLYKLTWECDGLKDLDTTYTDVSIWVGTYNVFDDTFNDDDGTKFKNVDYNKHSIKFSYSDLEKLVPQPPLTGHNPPSIRVQLVYREF